MTLTDVEFAVNVLVLPLPSLKAITLMELFTVIAGEGVSVQVPPYILSASRFDVLPSNMSAIEPL